MSNTVNIAIAAIPSIAASALAYATNASPIEYGIVGTIFVLGLVPIVKWMMARMDFTQKQEADLLKSREDRADNQLEAITKIVTELQTLNHNHTNFSIMAMSKIDAIQTKIDELKDTV